MVTLEEISKYSPMLLGYGLKKDHTDTIYYICQGYRGKDIAEKLGISLKAVNYRIRKINDILGTDNKIQIALKVFNLIDKEKSLPKRGMI